MGFSSRNTMGRPVPRLILLQQDQFNLWAETMYLLVVEPIETAPDAGRDDLTKLMF